MHKEEVNETMGSVTVRRWYQPNVGSSFNSMSYWGQLCKNGSVNDEQFTHTIPAVNMLWREKENKRSMVPL
jgi:hypothetical protein